MLAARSGGARRLRQVGLVGLLLGLLGLGLPGRATAQAPTHTLSGDVRDRTDAPVAGVPVQVTGTATATTITDAAGRWTFAGLAAGGTYTVTPTQPGWTFAPGARTVTGLARDHADETFVVTAGLFTRYFAEGATGDLFTTTFALLNPTDVAADTTLTFQTPDGTAVPVPFTLPPHTRHTVNPATVPGLDATALATVLTSTQPIVADRTMRWDARGYGSHTETSVAAPHTQWYLAEGATLGDFQLFYLIQNPGSTPAAVEVTYLRPAPQAPLVKTYPVGPRSRFNIWVNLETFDTPAGPQPLLAAAEMSAVVQSDVPVIVERAMYLSRPGRPFDAGHASAAAPALAPTWFLAEGATGPYFDQFALIANPNAEPAEVEVTYLLPSDRFAKTYTVAPQSRFTLWVDHADPRLADTPVSLAVVSTTGVPILVERAMWWPGDAATWAEGHTSRGATATAESWALADGEVGGLLHTETYVLVANTSPFAADVAVTAQFEDGTSATRTYPVPATSRFTIAMGDFLPETAHRRFGIVVDSRPTGHGTARLVVERATYNDAVIDGQRVPWAAGANAFGTPLRTEPRAEATPAVALAASHVLAIPALAGLPPITVTPDPAHAAHADLSPAGGTMVATAADGTRYTLTVPRGALRTPTTLTLTPVTALAGLPVPVSLIAGVHGAPDGLTFSVPATLTIELPQVPSGLLVGLQVPDAGTRLEILPVPRHGATLTIPVTHFSTVAIPQTTAALLAQVVPAGPYAQALQLIGTATTTFAPVDAAPALAFLTQWYDTAIGPEMLSAADVAAADDRRLAALATFYRWDSLRGVVEALLGHLDVGGTRIRGQLTGRATDGRQTAVVILAHGYTAWNTPASRAAPAWPTACAWPPAPPATPCSPSTTWRRWRPSRPTRSRSIRPRRPTATPGASGTSRIPASFCVSETLSVSEPALAPGATGSIRVTAGVVFGAGPPAVGDVMDVGFQPDPPGYSGYQHGRTTASGEAFFPVTADANGQLAYRVCATVAPRPRRSAWSDSTVPRAPTAAARWPAWWSPRRRSPSPPAPASSSPSSSRAPPIRRSPGRSMAAAPSPRAGASPPLAPPVRSTSAPPVSKTPRPSASPRSPSVPHHLRLRREAYSATPAVAGIRAPGPCVTAAGRAPHSPPGTGAACSLTRGSARRRRPPGGGGCGGPARGHSRAWLKST